MKKRWIYLLMAALLVLPLAISLKQDTAFAKSYTVTVTYDDTKGTATVDGAASASVNNNGSATLAAEAKEGYTFKKWQLSEGASANLTGNQLTNIKSDVTVTAVFEAVQPAPGNYTVTVQSNNNAYGSASADPTTVAAGGSSTLTAEPEEGYELEKWEVEGTATLTGNELTDIGSNVTVTAVFKEKGQTQGRHDLPDHRRGERRRLCFSDLSAGGCRRQHYADCDGE